MDERILNREGTCQYLHNTEPDGDGFQTYLSNDKPVSILGNLAELNFPVGWRSIRPQMGNTSGALKMGNHDNYAVRLSGTDLYHNGCDGER